MPSFSKGCCRIFSLHTREKDIYEMECLSVSPILNFPLLVFSLSWERLLIQSVLKGFHCAFLETLLRITDIFIVSTALMEDAVIPLLSLVFTTTAHAS